MSPKVEVRILVDDELVPEFYEMAGRWMAGKSPEAEEELELLPWADTEEDLELARVVWGKLSERAKDMFSALMKAPDERFVGAELATRLSIPNGKYGVAGVLAWPGRHSKAVGRRLPIEFEYGPTGESASYWMTNDVAKLFSNARSS